MEWVLLHLACTRIGAVLVNVNPAYRAYELAFVLRKSGMKALFLWERDGRSDYRAILGSDEGREARAGARGLFWDGFVGAGCGESGVDIGECRGICAEDVTNIQYTSGTTGSPKGVLLTHRNLLNNAEVIAIWDEDHGAGSDLRAGAALSLFWKRGGDVGDGGDGRDDDSAVGDVRSAGDDAGNPRRTGDGDLWRAHDVHCGAGASRVRHEFDFRSLRTGVMAGAPCPIEVMKRVVNEMHCPEMTIMYGQTESSPVITMSSVEDSLERRVSTVGGACPNTEVKIVSAAGETVAVGEQGELCTRGYLVMKGYDQEPEATKRAVDDDGWLHTGDLATMRPDGYFRVTGRAKDMIIRGGENIYPREVEEFLYTHPKVADVQMIGLAGRKAGRNGGGVDPRAKEPATEGGDSGALPGEDRAFQDSAVHSFCGCVSDDGDGEDSEVQNAGDGDKERGLKAAAEIQTA